MADYSITAVTRRAVYSGSAGRGPYSFSFPVLAETDLAVYIDSTLKTRTTHWTATISSSNGTGTVTFDSSVTEPTSSNTITIVGARSIERTTDFVTAGDLLASSLNTELDSQTIFNQQVSEDAARAIKAPVYDPSTIDMTLPAKATRAGKVLTFDSSTGNPTTSIAATDVTTIAGISDDVTTVSGIASNVTAVAGNATNINTVAGNQSNINSVAAKSSLITSDFVSDLNTVAVTDVINDLNTLATSDIVTDINLLATSDIVSDLNTLATSDIVSDLNTLATSDIVDDLNILGTSANVTNMATLGASGVVGNIATVAGNNSNVTAVAGNNSNITAVADNETNINAVNSNATNINAVAGNNSNITSVAGNATNINAVAGNATNINSVAGNSTNINTVAGNNTNINTVASNITGVNSFAERYRVDSSDPSSSLDEGDLAFNTTANVLKYYDGSAWQSIVAGSLTDIVQDGSPQLGGNLDVQTNSIVSTSNRDIAITPNGSGKVVLDGLSMPTADGNSGEALVTNGSGTISFSEVAGGGKYLGNDGGVGSDANDIIRVHSNTLDYSGTLTLASTENGLVAGPFSIAGSTILDVQGTLVVL